MLMRFWWPLLFDAAAAIRESFGLKRATYLNGGSTARQSSIEEHTMHVSAPRLHNHRGLLSDAFFASVL